MSNKPIATPHIELIHSTRDGRRRQYNVTYVMDVPMHDGWSFTTPTTGGKKANGKRKGKVSTLRSRS